MMLDGVAEDRFIVGWPLCCDFGISKNHSSSRTVGKKWPGHYSCTWDYHLLTVRIVPLVQTYRIESFCSTVPRHESCETTNGIMNSMRGCAVSCHRGIDYVVIVLMTLFIVNLNIITTCVSAIDTGTTLYVRAGKRKLERIGCTKTDRLFRHLSLKKGSREWVGTRLNCRVDCPAERRNLLFSYLVPGTHR